jgi:hypothetical protein
MERGSPSGSLARSSGEGEGEGHFVRRSCLVRRTFDFACTTEHEAEERGLPDSFAQAKPARSLLGRVVSF